MSNYIDDRLAFIDLETLGSDRPVTPVIECAIAVTNFSLQLLQQKSWIFPRALDRVRLHEIDPHVLAMHSSNGLWKDLIDTFHTQKTIEDTWQEIRTWLSHVTGRNQSPWKRILVAGSGFDHFDRPIIEHQAPDLASILTYYSLDIGSAERITEILGGMKIAKVETNHRALTCVLTQIERMRTYVGIQQRLNGMPPEQNVLYLHEQRTQPS